MYSPESFREQRLDRLMELTHRHPFGLLISTVDHEPVVSHLPMLLEAGPGSLVVIGHMARANPHAEILRSGSRALVVFSGPHGYVSPYWYETPGVPTWNYVTVHLKGRVRVIDEAAEVCGLVERMIERFESGIETERRRQELIGRFQHLLTQITGFAVDVEQMEGKFKLSQNRPLVDQRRVAEALRCSARAMDQELARWMDEVYAEATARAP